MTSLAELQRRVRDAVFATGQDEQARAAAGALLASRDPATAAGHLQIYRQAILATLVRALESIYPVCRQLVGDEFFAAMGRLYARRYPSESPDLGDYGEHLADFITDFEPAAELPYLPDVARLEWAWHRAFHAPDEAGLDIAALEAAAAEDGERIVFRLPRSATLLTSDFPVQRIWQVNQPDWTGDAGVDLDAGACRLMIWRQGHEMRIDEPDPPAWSLLSAIAAGCALGDAAPVENLDTLLPACVQRGWIAGFELRRATP